MGCCFSSDEDKTYAEQGNSERTHLLNDPVRSDAQPSTRQGRTSSYNSPAAPSQQKGDEQSALNRILHQTANNVIDVAAIDSQAMEQHEYRERARQYSTKLSLAVNKSHLRTEQSLPPGVAAPQMILAAPPVSLEDIQFVGMAAEQASKALHDVKVRHKEDLVVPFGVP